MNNTTAQSLKVYFNNYIWQIASFISRIASMVWVTPYLSSDKGNFGVYSLVISLTLLMNYADFGFFRAAIQYGAQAYIKNDRLTEYKVLGFTALISCVIYTIIVLCFIGFGFYPKSIIGTADYRYLNLASSLFFWLAFFTPFQLIQKLVASFYDIRMEGYVFQRIQLFTNITPILLIGLFKGEGNFQILYYFIFTQCLTVFCCVYGIVLIRNRYRYSVRELIRNIRLNKSTFYLMKDVAFSGYWLYVLWFLWNDFDRIFIGKFLGIEELASYMVVNYIFMIIINLNTILFQPLIVKANYSFSTLGIVGLKAYLQKVFDIFFPIQLIFISIIIFLLPGFIQLWVGPSYLEIITPAKVLVASFCLITIAQLINVSLTIQGRTKEMNFISTLQAAGFWFIVLLCFKKAGVGGIIVSKAVFIFIGHLYLIWINKSGSLLNISYSSILKDIIFIILVSFGIINFLQSLQINFANKSLIFFILYYSLGVFLIFLLFCLWKKEFRIIINSWISHNLKMNNN